MRIHAKKDPTTNIETTGTILPPINCGRVCLEVLRLETRTTAARITPNAANANKPKYESKETDPNTPQA